MSFSRHTYHLMYYCYFRAQRAVHKIVFLTFPVRVPRPYCSFKSLLLKEENERGMTFSSISDTGDSEEKNPSSPNRSRTDDLLLTTWKIILENLSCSTLSSAVQGGSNF